MAVIAHEAVDDPAPAAAREGPGDRSLTAARDGRAMNRMRPSLRAKQERRPRLHCGGPRAARGVRRRPIHDAAGCNERNGDLSVHRLE